MIRIGSEWVNVSFLVMAQQQQLFIAVVAEMQEFIVSFAKIDGVSTFYTVSQKKGCHPNHGYNFVNS